MTTRRILAVELSHGGAPAILFVSPPRDAGDVFRGGIVLIGHVVATSVGLPTALATFESLASQLKGFGWDGVPGAGELLRVASTEGP